MALRIPKLGLYEDPELTDELDEELDKLRLARVLGVEPKASTPPGGGFLNQLIQPPNVEPEPQQPRPTPTPQPMPTLS